MTVSETMRTVVPTGHGNLDKLEYRQDSPSAVLKTGR